MSFGREEYEDYASKKREEGTRSRLPMLRALSAVAPQMQALTNDQKWDQYLAYLSGMLEELREARVAAMTRLADPSLVNRDQIMQVKMALAINDAQIMAFEIARDLPKAIMDSADAARIVIERWEGGRGKPA